MNKFSTTVEEREKQCHVVPGYQVLEFFNKNEERGRKYVGDAIKDDITDY